MFLFRPHFEGFIDIQYHLSNTMRAVEHVGLWPSARTPASEQRTDKQKTWLAGTKPLLDFICDKVLFINPRTAHRRQGEQSNVTEREKQLEIQLLL